MDYFTTITKKGQITIPKKIRDKLGFEQFLKVKLEIDKKRNIVEVKPVPDIISLAEKFKVKKKKNVLEARKKMEESYKRK